MRNGHSDLNCHPKTKFYSNGGSSNRAIQFLNQAYIHNGKIGSHKKLPQNISRLTLLPSTLTLLAACGGGGTSSSDGITNNDRPLDDLGFQEDDSVRLSLQSIDVSDIEFLDLMLFSPVNFDSDDDIDFVVSHGYFPRQGEIYPPENVYSFVPFVLENIDGVLTRQPIFGDVPQLTMPSGFIVTDFNNDGFPDIIVAGFGYDAPPFPGERNVLLYGGPNGLTDKSDLLPDGHEFTHSVAAGDLSGNGYPDIYVGNLNAPYLIINQDGQIFEKVNLNPAYFHDQSAPSTGMAYTSSLIANLFGDDNALIVGSYFSETRIFTYDAELLQTNLFKTLPEGLFGANTIVLDIEVGDLNGDNLNDLVLLQTADYKGAGIQIFLQNSEGNLIDATENLFLDFDLGNSGYPIFT